jgi:hypothetical protein
MKSTLLLASMAIVAASWIGGCGGSDSSGTNDRGVDIYVTDQFADRHSQVWVTLHRIEVGDGATFTTVYENETGNPLNVVSLKDSAELLASVSLPDTPYTHVRVTYADQVTLVDKEGKSSTVPVSPTDDTTVESGKAVHVSKTKAPFRPSAEKRLVVDFQLATFDIVGGKLKVGIRPEPPADFDNKVRWCAVPGTITNLSTTSFTLRPDMRIPQVLGGPDGRPDVRSLTVNISESTSIVGPDGTVAVLANGQDVLVRGNVDKDSGTIAATHVLVRPANNPKPPTGGPDPILMPDHLGGEVTAIDKEKSTITVAPFDANRIGGASGVIAVGADTKVLVAGAGRPSEGSLSDIAVGDPVVATGRFGEDGILQARTVAVRRIPAGDPRPPFGRPRPEPGPKR